MKLITGGALLAFACSVSAQWYPNDQRGDIPKTLTGYQQGQEVPIECIQRSITQNGEHLFDKDDKIIYAPFFKCKESGKPFSLKYGIDENVNCTFGFTDELYHLFQIYIHEDAPFSCRIPVSSEPNSISKGGAFIPLTFNFRGELHDSHLDIDGSLNLIAIESSNGDQKTIISASAWSSGTNTTRIVIGNELTINFGVRWVKNLAPIYSSAVNGDLPYQDGFYRLSKGMMSMSQTWFYYYVIFWSVFFSGLTFFAVHRLYSPSRLNYRSFDSEANFTKKD